MHARAVVETCEGYQIGEPVTPVFQKILSRGIFPAFMNVAFRVDATDQIGTGHLIRCLTLADALREEGARVRFISGDLPDDLGRLVLKRGNELVVIGVIHSETEDATKSIRVLSDCQWDWLVVDHYGLSAVWETAMRQSTVRIMVIDDLANRAHQCEILLDQNYLPEAEVRYHGKVNPGCRQLLGPRFALLRPEYRYYREIARSQSTEVRRVLVFFGGSDPDNLTGLALDVLCEPAFRHLQVDIICGRHGSRRLTLEQQAEGRSGTMIHGPRPHLADLMSIADLAIGGGGSTSWERMCLGLRSIVITLAANQEQVANWLSHEGLTRLIGQSGRVTAIDLRESLMHELQHGWQLSVTEKGMLLCDGLGTERVVGEMQKR